MNAAILKDSNYNEVDRAECQFATTSTVLDNGSQVSGSRNKNLHSFEKKVMRLVKQDRLIVY